MTGAGRLTYQTGFGNELESEAEPGVLPHGRNPSVLDEANPDVRNVELDLYDQRNPNQPPYSAEFLSRFRAAQLARVRRRTAYVRELLDQIRAREGPAAERGLLTHRTLRQLAAVGFVLAEDRGTSRLYRINGTCVECFPTAADLVMGRPALVPPPPAGGTPGG